MRAIVENGKPVVKLPTGSFIWPTVENIDDQLFSLAEEMDWKKLHLDFRDVEFLTAAGLGKLVVLRIMLKTTGRKLSLHNVGPVIYEVFEVTSLSKIFDIRMSQKGS
jgi:anti-anti-sigma factor